MASPLDKAIIRHLRLFVLQLPLVHDMRSTMVCVETSMYLLRFSSQPHVPQCVCVPPCVAGLATTLVEFERGVTFSGVLATWRFFGLLQAQAMLPPYCRILRSRWVHPSMRT